MPLRPLLRLTQDEKRWSDYFSSMDANGRSRHGVVNRLYPFSINLTGARPTATAIFRTSRRSRVYGITWSGDVNAARVQLTSSTGETYFVQPLHIPLVSGHGVWSTLNEGAGLFPPYPTAAVVGAAPVFTRDPMWDFEIEPNWVLPANKQLQFDYTLENPNDPALTVEGMAYQINHVVCVFEFPGWKGDPRT